MQSWGRQREVERVRKERIGRAGAATRFHIDGDFSVWLDTDVGVCDGLVVGVGETRSQAIRDAIRELKSRVEDLEQAL